MNRKREPIIVLGRPLKWWADLLERQDRVIERLRALEKKMKSGSR